MSSANNNTENEIKEPVAKKATELFIFTREDNLDVIMDALFECYGVPKYDCGNQLWLKNNFQSLNNIVFLPDMGEDFPDFIKDQKNRVCGHFAYIEECDPDIRVNFIHHMQQCKGFIDVKVECFSEDEEIQHGTITKAISVLLEFIKKTDGILLINGATTALNKDGKVIISDNGTTGLDYYFPFEYTENPPVLAKCTPGQLKRRNENMKYLYDNHIYVPELPLNDDDNNINIRSKEEIVKRALGTLTVSLYSECMLNPAENMSVSEAREFAYNVMDTFGFDNPADIMSPEELGYFQDDNPEQSAKINYSWHYENVYVLEWALGLDEWTEPVNICDVPKSVRLLKTLGTYEDICNAVTVRSKKEILDKADLIYRMDWACVDARIHRMTAPGKLEQGVVQARHKTLNWLICFGNDDWDDVDIPT